VELVQRPFGVARQIRQISKRSLAEIAARDPVEQFQSSVKIWESYSKAEIPADILAYEISRFYPTQFRETGA
jgi:hypothetical protein